MTKVNNSQPFTGIRQYDKIDGSEPSKAIDSAIRRLPGKGPCQTNDDRTYLMYVQNDTPYSFVLVLFQAIDECKDGPPSGYVANTGVFVGGVNLPYGEDAQADPCNAGGSGLSPIQASRLKCSLQYHTQSGKDFTINLKDIVLSPGEDPCSLYMGTGRWRLYIKTARGKETVASEIITEAKARS